MASVVTTVFNSARPVSMNPPVPYREGEKSVAAGVKLAVRLVTTVVAMLLVFVFVVLIAKQ